MKITFLGGTETVTGSKYLIETQGAKILVDCGLFQGYKWLRRRNRHPLPLDIKSLDAVVLTHAHLDHSGYIPVLYNQGFSGPIYTHHATKELCALLLEDSAHILEQDASFYGKHKLSKHEDPEPLYDVNAARKCMALFQTVDFEERFTVGDMELYLQSAGHILGAASIILHAEGKRVGFSGDVGRPNDVFMKPPATLPELDLLLLESTYGDCQHSHSDPFQQLADQVNESVKGGGNLLIPSFAVGRAQTLQYILASLMADERIPNMPIYLDSPMAIDVSDIYCRYSDEHRLSDQQCHLMNSKVTYTRSVDESKSIYEQLYPHIIIAGSGMATGGRILHHLKRLLSDHRTTVLFTGYQAGGTRGAKMIAGVNSIKIHGEWITNLAQIKKIDGLSAHADYLDIEQWLKQSAQKKLAIQLVHGSCDALEGLREHLLRTTNFTVNVATYKSILTV